VAPTDHDTQASLIGRALDERYVIDAEIGRGGLGCVYRATHQRLGKAVAIKLLHDRFGQEPSLRARFEREAKALATLDHPNIVLVTDYGIAEDAPYLVMELLEGETLAQRLTRGPLAPADACALARPLLAALAFAHAHGVVHRDLKPANVFLQRQPDGSERVKLLDFGLAKRTQTAGASDPTLTRRGDRLGTPAYMSPEQVGGDALDARSDVYSAGVIIFEMLAGQLPFEGELAEQMRAHLVEPLPPLPAKVPLALDALVQRALAKKPAERFANAGDMLAALGTAPFAAGARARAPRTGLVARAVAGALLSGARILTALALVVIVLALSAIYLAQHRQAGPEHTGARDGTR